MRRAGAGYGTAFETKEFEQSKQGSWLAEKKVKRGGGGGVL